ncbi:MAG: NAD(P)/FAD-dependent oxidoreductase, partial [Actinomycetota bacterium]
VTVVHRRDKLRASKIMQDRAMAHDKISFVWDSTVDEVLGDGKVSAVRLRNLKSGDTSEREAGGIFVAIGHQPNSSLFQGVLEMDATGYLIIGDKLSDDWAPGSPFQTRTNVEGVFAAGDVVDHTYRQAVTAAGMGCEAAMDAERWLEARGH